jgi:hypothetical protein
MSLTRWGLVVGWAVAVAGCGQPTCDDKCDTAGETPSESGVDTPSDTITDTPADTPADTTSDPATDTDPRDTDAPVDTPADTPADTDVSPTSCKDAGGICTSGPFCGAAAELSSFAADCVFDDGPGVCCEAPAPAPTGRSCEALGGVCAPIGGCLMVDGFLVDANSGCNAGPSYTCCVPESVCGPAEYDCCVQGQTSYRSTCIRGTESCDHLPGTTPVPIGSCLTP